MKQSIFFRNISRVKHTANFTRAVIFFYNPIFKLLKSTRVLVLYVVSIRADVGLSVISHYDNLPLW